MTQTGTKDRNSGEFSICTPVKLKHKKPELIPRHAPSCTNFHLGTPSLLLVLLCLLGAAPTMGLTLFALNANGMNNILKVQHINTAIRTRNPSVFVISELKSKVPVMGELPGDCYNRLRKNPNLLMELGNGA